MLEKNEMLAIWFLNVDLGEKRTGVESAALARAQLFKNELNLTPRIISRNYRPHQRDELRRMVARGELPEDVKVFNIYDAFQDLWSDDEKGGHEPDFLEGRPSWRRETVEGHNHDRIFDAQGELRCYAVRNPITDRTHWVNHFYKKKIYRRDYHDCRGFLSCTQILDIPTGEVMERIFFRRDGSIALLQHHERGADKKVVSTISQLIGRNGEIVEVFHDDDELIRYGLQLVLNREGGRDHVLIIDRNPIFYKMAIGLRNENQENRIFVVPVVHAVHVVDARNLETSRTNSNFAAFLDDLKTPDAVVVLTERQRADILRRYGNGNVRTIPHSCKITEKADAASGRQRYKAVYLARYSAEKQHDLAIKAFSKIVETLPQATLYCYGYGAIKKDLEKLIKELRLEENVFLPEWVDQISDVYEEAGLTILTSRTEGFSLTVLESLAHGCPVVGFDVAYGPAEMIMDGCNGYLVPFSDTDLLAQRIIDVMTCDDDSYDQMCAGARASAARFSSARVALEWKSLLSALSTPSPLTA